MDAVKNDVKRLVKIELAAANKKFRMFAGPHEGAGIIQEELEEAGALVDVSHMPARVKCAVLGWHTMEEMLDKKNEK